MTSALLSFNNELSSLIDKVLPSTVTIEGYSKDLSENSQGSGWFYSSDLVVTNYHVIETLVNPLTVTPVGRPPMVGEVVGSDPDNDIAVIKVKSLEGTPLILEKELPKLGELCVAIGSPHSFRESASLGIISGLSRQIRTSNSVIEEMIQTDAAVNPGNSGGPLVNIHGRVIGMNTMGPAETVNLAVPAETLACVVPELEAHGSILNATIGISISVIQHHNSDSIMQSIAIRKVKNEAQTPLKSGDILKEINGRKITRRIDAIRALGRDTIDQQVKVLIERDGALKTVEILAKAKITTNS
jgi:serine protease Do